MATPECFKQFARYNSVMNEKIYDVAATLSDADRKADRGAFFGPLHGTLNHILFGDRALMMRMTAKVYELGGPAAVLYEDFEELSAARQEMDAEIEGFVAGLTQGWLDEAYEWHSQMDGITRTQTRWLLVAHMFNHQTHHRGQATTLLSQMGVDVGVTDLPRVL